MRSFLAGMVLTGLAGCAAPPAEQARGTPAAAIAANSVATIMSNGVTVGAGLQLTPSVLATSAHVVRQAGGGFVLRRHDGMEIEGNVLAMGRDRDFALIRTPLCFLRPALLAPAPPLVGEALWALGPQGLGRAMAQGSVEASGVRLRGFGEGLIVRVGVLMGFSGGPVVNDRGEAVGLITALLGAQSDVWLAMLSGVDLGGLLRGDQRRVFVLDIASALMGRRFDEGLPAAAGVAHLCGRKRPQRRIRWNAATSSPLGPPGLRRRAFRRRSPFRSDRFG